MPYDETLQEALDKELPIANPDDLKENFWGHNYRVVLDRFVSVIVNAGYESQALDIAMDYALYDRKWTELFMDNKDIEELRAELEPEYGDAWDQDRVCGGNEGKYLSEMSGSAGMVWELK